MVGQCLQRQRAGQVLREQAQRLRVLEMAQHVHLRFGVAAGLVELGAQLRAQLRASRARA